MTTDVTNNHPRWSPTTSPPATPTTSRPHGSRRSPRTPCSATSPREFIGMEAIRGFGAKEIFGDNVTMDVHRAWDRSGNITVHARFDGTYDKTGLPNPLILSTLLQSAGRFDHPAHLHPQQDQGLKPGLLKEDFIMTHSLTVQFWGDLICPICPIGHAKLKT